MTGDWCPGAPRSQRPPPFEVWSLGVILYEPLSLPGRGGGLAGGAVVPFGERWTRARRYGRGVRNGEEEHQIPGHPEGCLLIAP